MEQRLRQPGLDRRGLPGPLEVTEAALLPVEDLFGNHRLPAAHEQTRGLTAPESAAGAWFSVRLSRYLEFGGEDGKAADALLTDGAMNVLCPRSYEARSP